VLRVGVRGELLHVIGAFSRRAGPGMVGAWVVSLLAPRELHNGCHADMAAGFRCNCLEGDDFADDVDCWIGQYNMSST
jgi:hypothetical protein